MFNGVLVGKLEGISEARNNNFEVFAKGVTVEFIVAQGTGFSVAAVVGTVFNGGIGSGVSSSVAFHEYGIVAFKVDGWGFGILNKDGTLDLLEVVYGVVAVYTSIIAGGSSDKELANTGGAASLGGAVNLGFELKAIIGVAFVGALIEVCFGRGVRDLRLVYTGPFYSLVSVGMPSASGLVKHRVSTVEVLDVVTNIVGYISINVVYGMKVAKTPVRNSLYGKGSFKVRGAVVSALGLVHGGSGVVKNERKYNLFGVVAGLILGIVFEKVSSALGVINR
jgi:hypothetical protein